MSQTIHLDLAYLEANQAQKHVTVNEALRTLDALVHLSVLSAAFASPPGSPAEGDRYIIAASPTGVWTGRANQVACWIDGGWLFHPPGVGWSAWNEATSGLLIYSAGAWTVFGGGGPGSLLDISDSGFSLADNTDPTKKLDFQLSAISTGITRTLVAPDASGTIALLSGDQTFSGAIMLSNPIASIGTSIANATYGFGAGVTSEANTKTINLGTGGAPGSTTLVNIGSDEAGALGTTVINTPIVAFADSVTVVGMPQANLTAKHVGIGGATADSYNQLSVNTPAMLFNNVGAGIEATFNKAGAENDAAFAFKTGFSARALIGLLGSDDFSVKVSPDGATYHEAIRIDRTSGRVELPEPLYLQGQTVVPDPPPAGKLAIYARDRAGAGWLDVQRPSGRFFPLQAHFGVNRIATWAPSTSSIVNTNGMPRTAVGTVTTPTLATADLATSMRRWRMTSAATADAVAEERSTQWVCWRGNVGGLGGWSYVNRFALNMVQPTGMAFFGLYGATSALATTLTLATVVNCIGIGFQRGTDTNWQIVHNDGSGAPSVVDLGASFPVTSLTNVLTLYLAAAPNGSDIGVRVVEEVSGTAVEFTITSDMPASTQLLSPRNYMNNGTTAAAVAYDCAGVYVETDY